MSFEVDENIPLGDLYGRAGRLPVPQKRFQNMAALRLALAAPFFLLPTQLFLRGLLDQAWAPTSGAWIVDSHLWATLLYVPLNILLWRCAKPESKHDRNVLVILNALCILCELVANQAFLSALGNFLNFSVAYLVLFVALYRVLFGYRAALWTAGSGIALFGAAAFLEFGGVMSSAPLFPEVYAHPFREQPGVWLYFIFSVFLIVTFAFLISNYAVNQAARLHTYVTRSVLQRYLPAELVDRAAEGELTLDAPPERRVVTVMFTDIVGFTTLSERMGPEGVGELLSRFLGEVADLALEHGATVDKFIGDCVMVVFGVPVACSPEEQARRCVALAQAIHARVQQMGSEYALQARTGINTGEAVVGNFGSASRSDYTVLGHAVNVAARLEAASKPDRILIGPDTMKLLDDTVALESAGELSLKGVSTPVRAWFVAA